MGKSLTSRPGTSADKKLILIFNKNTPLFESNLFSSTFKRENPSTALLMLFEIQNRLNNKIKTKEAMAQSWLCFLTTFSSLPTICPSPSPSPSPWGGASESSLALAPPAPGVLVECLLRSPSALQLASHDMRPSEPLTPRKARGEPVSWGHLRFRETGLVQGHVVAGARQGQASLLSRE